MTSSNTDKEWVNSICAVIHARKLDRLNGNNLIKMKHLSLLCCVLSLHFTRYSIQRCDRG